MTTILEVLKEKIQNQGAISVAEYMDTCLYHEKFGYYMSREPLGQKGDFTTAPEISQIFGEMIGAWVADSWIKLGKPNSWQLLETGPGNGTLMKDILRTLEYALPECYEGASITLLEISPTLKTKQRETLEKHRVSWENSLNDVNFEKPTIVIGNELLDAFPVRQFKQKEENLYKEKLITFEGNQFKWVESDESTKLNLSGEVVETSDAMESFLCKLKDKLTNGVALFIDYGDHATGDSLQAVEKHQKIDIFQTPGESDLTAHVNFDNVRRVLGLDRTSFAEPMGQFLNSIGMPMRAAALLERATDDQKQEIEQATYRLMHPEQMGETFKVIAYRTHSEYDLAGVYFEAQPKSHVA